MDSQVSYFTSRFRACFNNRKTMLNRYTDAHMASNIDGRMSISGYLVTFAGGANIMAKQITKFH